MVSRRSASRGQPGTRTEVALGVLLVGLPVLIKVHHTQPRGGVTIWRNSRRLRRRSVLGGCST